VTASTLTARRRHPQQQRSRELVSRVLDAAERMLATDAGATLSTTRIAHEAGVSVGALYQYFPDTGAVVAALARRHMDAFEALMEHAVTGATDGRWEDPVGVLVDAVADRYREEPGYRVLWFGPHLTVALREADRRNKLALADGLRRVLIALELARDDGHLVTVCQAAVHTCDALLQEAFRREPSGDEALLEEAKALLRAYLERVAAHYADPGGTR
jgi:AcrR family transcriptional regulator